MDLTPEELEEGTKRFLERQQQAMYYDAKEDEYRRRAINKDGQLYGITYVDHKTHCVFNGSQLGKEFSAKGILEQCERNISHHEKHYQKLTSATSKITLNLDSNLNIKPISIDI